jgi:hypothetical protein
VGGLPSGLPLCGHGYTRDFLPDLESLGHLLAIRGSGKPVASRAEVLGNGTIGGEEALGMPRGFEALHPPLPLTGGLVRILGAVIQIAVLAMFYPRQNLPLRGTIALQLICDAHPWDILAAFEELVGELFAATLSRRRWTRISKTLPS